MISIVLPVYNCAKELEQSLPALVQLLQQKEQVFEIVIVDDGSQEGSVIRDIAVTHGCVYIRNEENRGKGYTVRRGILAATGNAVICMDGDFPFELQVVYLMIEMLLKPGAAVVIGDRTLPESAYPSSLPLLRKVGSFILSSIAGTLFTPGFYDTQCGIKGYTAQAAKDIFSRVLQEGFSFDLEVLFIATRRRLPVARVPVTVKTQHSSTVQVAKDGLAMFAAFFTIYFNQLRGKYK